MIPLRVARLTLKDKEQLQQIIDEETAKLTRLYPFTDEAIENFISKYNTYGVKYSKHTLIGAFEIKESGETAYVVAKNWRNQGVCTEALKLAKRIARKELGVNNLWCYIHPSNKASIKVAKKAGLRIEYYDKEKI